MYLFCWELRDLSPNFHIHVSVRDLYIPRIHISCSRIGRSIMGIYTVNRSQTHECGNWDCGRTNFFSGNICFQFSVLVLCSATNSVRSNIQILQAPVLQCYSVYTCLWLCCVKIPPIAIIITRGISLWKGGGTNKSCFVVVSCCSLQDIIAAAL